MNRKHPPTTSFRAQIRQSTSELQSIMNRRLSPLGEGQFTIRTVEVVQPSSYNAKSVKVLRRSLRVSQAVFAQLLGVSPALESISKPNDPATTQFSTAIKKRRRWRIKNRYVEEERRRVRSKSASPEGWVGKGPSASLSDLNGS